jgi:Ankyrin repeats (3 copies)
MLLSPFALYCSPAMADARFCVGFSKACKQARQGGGLPGYEGRVSRGRPLRPFLPPDLVRLIDALVRRLEHEDTLLRMNGRDLGTTLCEAAAAGGLLDVRFLLARGANVEAWTEYTDVERDNATFELSPLEWSAVYGHVQVCIKLLDAGAEEREEALIQASASGRLNVVALMLDRGVDIHCQNNLALWYAVNRGQLDLVRLLLDRGADANASDGDALRDAAGDGMIDIVRLLLERTLTPVKEMLCGMRGTEGILPLLRFSSNAVLSNRRTEATTCRIWTT